MNPIRKIRYYFSFCTFGRSTYCPTFH